MHNKFGFCFILLTSILLANTTAQHNKRIQPWTKNSSYWQYKGKPILLLGASNDDNLFQEKDCLDQLKVLASVGGNYVRNTMSDRDQGDLRAFAQLEDGRYDLTKWNPEYWSNFETMLQFAQKHDIIVQIEIWDRFDHTDSYPDGSGKMIDLWQADPYNPKNNVNYSFEETSFARRYDRHPGSNEHSFFYTVPELQNNPEVLKYQQAFVLKLLSVSLQYDNVLYCIDNETSGAEEWARYWANFIKENCRDEKVYLTEMWDDWNVASAMHKRTIDHFELYDFIDLSQNSHNTGHNNWLKAKPVFKEIRNYPRPVNSTKVYGSDSGKWADRGITTNHAVQTVCRNIMGGFAASRFHRPSEGLGLSDAAQNCIETIRKIENEVKIWELDIVKDLTMDAGNEAYLRANNDDQYLIYLPEGGKVTIKLKDQTEKYVLKWIDTKDALWGEKIFLEGKNEIELNSQCNESCFGLLVVK